MQGVTIPAMAAIALGLSWGFVASPANAGSEIASQRDGLREVCTRQGGLFERSWAYNDQGMKWGEILSCSTSTGTIICRSGVCRVGARSRSNGATMAAGDATGIGGTAPFPAEMHAFSAALSGLNARQSPTTLKPGATR